MAASSSSSSSSSAPLPAEPTVIAGGGSPRRTRGGGFFRNAFQAMSDWGDDFERRHFEGDFVAAISRAPKKVATAGGNTFKAMSDWGDDFERRHFDGDFVGAAGAAIGGAVESVDNMLDGLVPLPGPEGPPLLTGQLELPPEPVAGPRVAAPAAPVAERPWEALQRQQEQRWRTEGRQAPVEAAATPALWDEVERLRSELAEERERRRGRAAALDAMAEALRTHRAALTEERRSTNEADERRSVADARAYTAERELAQMQERHHALLSRRATHDAELARLAVSASRAEQAELADIAIREAEGPRAWARAGPEMEALKDAKVELAEVLCLLDEARLHRRKELNAMNGKITELSAANKRFRLASDGYTAPEGSFRKSLRQLFAVARGG